MEWATSGGGGAAYCPYATLGIPAGTDFNEVRARYFQLARKHHPDKLPADIGAAEKAKHEEYFKRISVAYHKIEQNKNGGEGGADTANFDFAKIWKSVESVFNNPQTWDAMKTILRKAAKTAAAAKRKSAAPAVPKTHCVTVPLTLEDVHKAKDKRLRLFLTGIEAPIYITINAGRYINEETLHVVHTLNDGGEGYVGDVGNASDTDSDAGAGAGGGADAIDIIIQLRLQEHKHFRLLKMVNSWDIFYHIDISWCEYVTGKTAYINQYLDDQKIEITVPAFYNCEIPIIFENMGLAGKGNLFVIVNIRHPTTKEKFREILNALNAADVMETGKKIPKNPKLYKD